MRLSLVLSTLLLTACVATPVARKFPDVPEELHIGCQPLLLIDESTDKLSDVVKSVTTNYGYYQDCKDKNEAWKTWYDEQRQIFDSVN